MGYTKSKMYISLKVFFYLKLTKLLFYNGHQIFPDSLISGLFNYVSVTWRVDDFSKWNSWTEKMLAVELASQTLTGPVYVQRTSHLRVL